MSLILKKNFNNSLNITLSQLTVVKTHFILHCVLSTSHNKFNLITLKKSITNANNTTTLCLQHFSKKGSHCVGRDDLNGDSPFKTRQHPSNHYRYWTTGFFSGEKVIESRQQEQTTLATTTFWVPNAKLTTMSLLQLY